MTFTRPKEPTEAVNLGCVKVETSLHPHRDRSAESIQSEYRVGTWHDIDVGDGERWNQIPEDGTSKRLIDPRASLVDGEPLGRTENRRGVEPPKIEVRLKQVSLGVREYCRWKISFQKSATVGVVAASMSLPSIVRTSALTFPVTITISIGFGPAAIHGVASTKTSGASEIKALRIDIRPKMDPFPRIGAMKATTENGA